MDYILRQFKDFANNIVIIKTFVKSKRWVLMRENIVVINKISNFLTDKNDPGRGGMNIVTGVNIIGIPITIF